MIFSRHTHSLRKCAFSFSDYPASHFRYVTSEGGGGGGGGGGSGGNHHPVIDYRVTVSRLAPKKSLNSNERVMAAGLSKMLRRFSIGASEISTNKSENKS